MSDKQPVEPDFYERLRAKYKRERDRRIRPDGEAQYASVNGELARFVDHDPRLKEDIKRPPINDEVEVIIVGGGWSGLLVAGRLAARGVHDIRIVDDAGDFGGAWYWNQYPGAQCDIDSYCYLPLLEETGYMPEQKYSDAPEIQEYAKTIGKHYDLYKKAVFHTRVTEMRWDDAAKRWTLKTNRGDMMRARFAVLAQGQTTRAKLPGIPGLNEFEGQSFHTSRWDYEYTGGDFYSNLTNLADKNVGIIGTGCTAIQCIPRLAESSKHLYVFQRTPSAIDFRNNAKTDPDWYRSQKPGWQRRRRENFDDVINGRPFDEDLVADGWTEIIRKMKTGEYPIDPISPDADAAALASAAEKADFHKMEEIRARVMATIEHPETAEKLQAWYARMCKRPTFNDEYLETFNRSNVTLVDTADTQGVERLTKRGVVVGGVEYPLDCLIFSTGFEISSSYDKRLGINVFGRNGESLYDHWGDGMRTLHGHSLHGFPNWFFVGASQVGVTFNFVAVVDPMAEHVSYIISEVKRRNAEIIEATEEGEGAWVREVKDKTPKDLSFQVSCTPGYYNNEGKILETKATFWGDFYMGGYKEFGQILDNWRENGQLQGMRLE